MVEVADRIAAYMEETGVSRAALARAAGLHPNSLRHLGSADWNPTADTLRKLESVLSENSADPLVPIEEILAEARNGRMYILVDDEDRENEGDLIIPAQMATPDAINFMATHGRGLICLALTHERVGALGLQPMTRVNGALHNTAFTVSIEAKTGVTTGISAADRARTVAVAIDSNNGPDDIVSPGHVFPLAARDGGVLVRAGHTEAAVDVSRLAGLNPSGVICEVMRDDGQMARLPDLVPFARKHGLKIGTIRDLIAYRLQHDHLVKMLAETRFTSRFGGDWALKVYCNKVDHAEHFVLQKGRVVPGQPTLVRVHALSPFADILGETIPAASTLQRSMEVIGEAGAGIIVVIRDNRADRWSQAVGGHGEGKHLGGGQRNYGIGAQILVDLGVSDMELLINSPRSFIGLSAYGLNVVSERSVA